MEKQPDKKKMICPNCRAEMNHHARKVNYTAAFKHPEMVNPAFGGVLEEFHTCPACGKSVHRKVMIPE